MIKFFCQIRLKLLTDNLPTGQAGKFSPPERRSRAGKYLLYAIGEIVLVVIGILLALQINSWNQDRLAKKTEKVILNRLVKDLEVDHFRYQKLDSLYKQELEMNKEFNSLIKKTSQHT